MGATLAGNSKSNDLLNLKIVMYSRKELLGFFMLWVFLKKILYVAF
jgi:hypothetical protein